MSNRNLFNSIKVETPKKSRFDLSHDVKLTMNMGKLVPILSLETVPGDSFNISADSLIRFAPLISPVMHRMDVSIHYFFVPNRILWKNFDDFISGKNSNLVHPYCSTFTLPPSGIAEGTLADYLGIPSQHGVTAHLNVFPFAAYQKIYNEYYRDQNLIASVIGDDEILVDGDNGANMAELFKLRNRAWSHDYFTSALPGTQLGGVTTMPITGGVSIPAVPFVGELDGASVNVQDLRKSIKIQEWLELAMRAGRRYKETLIAYFGVDTDDARLNRPEYITGIKTPIVVSEVLNTTGAQNSNPQGAMAGHGVAVNVGNANSSYFCKEHGHIIGIMSVMPLPAYQDGIPRQFLRRDDRYSYYWPQFANLGEQGIYLNELRAATTNPNTIFGYTPRYSEYKYMPNRVAGNFKSSLNFWHCGRIFSNDPALNQQFIEMDPNSVDRIFAVKPTGSTHSIYAQVLNKITAIRPMPKFGTPSI